jgi:hypothetical protein
MGAGLLSHLIRYFFFIKIYSDLHNKQVKERIRELSGERISELGRVTPFFSLARRGLFSGQFDKSIVSTDQGTMPPLVHGNPLDMFLPSLIQPVLITHTVTLTHLRPGPRV